MARSITVVITTLFKVVCGKQLVPRLLHKKETKAFTSGGDPEMQTGELVEIYYFLK